MARSAAEQEIRDAVVARLRQIRPKARICHEVNCGIWGPTRMDLAAVDLDEIIGVEIKSEKDVLKRAEKQLAYAARVTHHSILALHEVHLEQERVTNEYAAHYGKLDGQHYRRDVPKFDHGQITWVYPEIARCPSYDDDAGPWREPPRRMEQALSTSALNLLWRDELAWLCDYLQISRGKRATMSDMFSALTWRATGKELTLGICAALRARKFAEADPVIALPTGVASNQFAWG